MSGKETLRTDQIDFMGDQEIGKLYACYEAKLGEVRTKTLGQAALQLYFWIANMVLPIHRESQPALIADYAADPFVGHACTEQSHRMYLAPLLFCQFEHTCPRKIMPEMTPQTERVTAIQVDAAKLSPKQRR